MITQTDLPGLLNRGKVRDTYLLNEGQLLMVATDRISAFDVVLPSGIPDKGLVLNRMSAFWFDQTSHLIPNHLIALADAPAAAPMIEASTSLGDLPAAIASAGYGRQAGRAHRHRVHRARLHHRLSVGRV